MQSKGPEAEHENLNILLILCFSNVPLRWINNYKKDITSILFIFLFKIYICKQRLSKDRYLFKIQGDQVKQKNLVFLLLWILSNRILGTLSAAIAFIETDVRNEEIYEAIILDSL